ncbi:MAG: hypothetical protein ACO3IJ_01490 [Steroidobacteraceae bacterium]
MTIAGLPILSLLIWLPILGGVGALVLRDERAEMARWLGLGVSVLTFLCSLPIWTGFDTTSAEM